MSVETDIQNRLRVAASGAGCMLLRNNSGACLDQTGRMIRYGLGNDSAPLNAVWKSSDLIGITPMMSTAPGQVFGVFTAIEVKAPGFRAPRNDRERAQEAFLQSVRELHGIGMFATDIETYLRGIGR